MATTAMQQLLRWADIGPDLRRSYAQRGGRDAIAMLTNRHIDRDTWDLARRNCGGIDALPASEHAALSHHHGADRASFSRTPAGAETIIAVETWGMTGALDKHLANTDRLLPHPVAEYLLGRTDITEELRRHALMTAGAQTRTSWAFTAEPVTRTESLQRIGASALAFIEVAQRNQWAEPGPQPLTLIDATLDMHLSGPGATPGPALRWALNHPRLTPDHLAQIRTYAAGAARTTDQAVARRWARETLADRRRIQHEGTVGDLHTVTGTELNATVRHLRQQHHLDPAAGQPTYQWEWWRLALNPTLTSMHSGAIVTELAVISTYLPTWSKPRLSKLDTRLRHPAEAVTLTDCRAIDLDTLDAATRTEVLARIDTELHGHAAAWSVVLDLADNFDGPLVDLISCAQMAAT